MYLCAAVVALLGCKDDTGGGGNGDAGLTTIVPWLQTGEPCESSAQCVYGACVRVDDDRNVCSQGCVPGDARTCPAGANWSCRLPNEGPDAVCACQADSAFEVCADGLDNDCDGNTDDCRECGGLLIRPDDARHCGACGRACVTGATCAQNECVCADGTAGPTCVRDGSAPECALDTECDDGIECTEDACRDGRCQSTVVPARCAADEVCDLRQEGCVRGQPCADDLDCDDGDPCTTSERCDPPTKVCLWLPLDGDVDGQPPRVCGGGDCNDADPVVYSGAPEQCDGTDNSCDGVVDLPIAPTACGERQTCEAGVCVCGGDETNCNGLCVDTESDESHCGSCVDVCVANAVCDEGACVCSDGFTVCSDGCFDLQTDDTRCGTCNNPCSVGSSCEEGVCVDLDECAEGTDTCVDESEDCVDASPGFSCACKPGFVVGTLDACVDRNECASNLNDCAANACVNTVGSFECACPAGFTGDGHTCADVDECATEDCGPNGVCVNSSGSFGCTCDPGYAFDGVDGCDVSNPCQAGLLRPDMDWCSDGIFQPGSCHDLTSDEAHCGACDRACGAQGTCVASDCDCNDGFEFCEGGGCVDWNSSTQHCGACGDPCPAGGSCVGGACYCPMNQLDCGGTCLAIGNTTRCLDCDDACPTGASCLAAGCTCPAGTPTTCLNTCVNTQTNFDHCGTCNDPCPAGATCVAGGCVCPMGQTDCTTTCAILGNDERHCGMCGMACGVVCSAGACGTVVAVDTGNNFACALLTDESVHCWGSAVSGALGNGSTSGTVSVPTRIVPLSDVQAIELGYTHGCAVINFNSELWCWGENGNYQSGGTVTTDRSVPAVVRTDVARMALGTGHTCVELTTGAIECRGSDVNGEHGDGATVTVGSTWSGPAVGVLSDVDDLVSGANHLCALKSGVVHCWGYGAYGQIGVGSFSNATAPTQVTGLSGVDDVAAGGNHSCAVIDGQVACWGDNQYQQLGVPSPTTSAFAVYVPGITTAVTVHAGSQHTCVELQNGEIRCFGYGADGRLGYGGSTAETATPQLVTGSTGFASIALGGTRSCAVLASDGDVSCWGNNVLSPTAITW